MVEAYRYLNFLVFFNWAAGINGTQNFGRYLKEAKELASRRRVIRRHTLLLRPFMTVTRGPTKRKISTGSTTQVSNQRLKRQLQKRLKNLPVPRFCTASRITRFLIF